MTQPSSAHPAAGVGEAAAPPIAQAIAQAIAPPIEQAEPAAAASPVTGLGRA